MASTSPSEAAICSVSDINGSGPALKCANASTPRDGIQPANYQQVADRLSGEPSGWFKAGGLLSFTGLNQMSGTWSINTASPSYNSDNKYALVLWGGNNLAAYLLPSTKTSGTWTTNGLSAGASSNNPDLSGMGLATIPLPAAAWLLIGGLAGLGALARRRRLA